MATKNKPLIVIAGPTASGKSSLAIKIAKECGGEIICADARTIYKGMNIGTAKPGVIDQKEIPHWGLDLVYPNEHFSAADFKKYATSKINEIRGRGNVPLVVGGTGLYIDAVIFDYKFGPAADEKQRQQLNSMSLESLWEYCLKHNIKLPQNRLNKRYVVRAIEQKGVNNSRNKEILENTIIVGISTEKTKLQARICSRAEEMLDNGVVQEAEKLAELYGWDTEAMKANIYQVIRTYLQGDIGIDGIAETAINLDTKLAKRQLVWFKRNPFIVWKSLRDAPSYLLDQLAKYN